jgi:hypothetical protein
VRDIASLRIPERSNELVERRGGDALQVKQGDLMAVIACCAAKAESGLR